MHAPASAPKKSSRDLDRELEALLANPNQLGPNLGPIVRALSTFLGGAEVSLYLFEEEGDELVLRGTTQRVRSKGESLRLAAAGTLAELALSERRTLSLTEATRPAGARRQAEQHIFPLEAAGRKLGVASVVCTAAERLSPVRLDMVRRRIQRLAEAIETTCREEALLRRMTRIAAINEFGVILVSVRNPEELPSLATAMASFIMGTEGCILRLREEETGDFTVRDAYGLRDEGSRKDLLRLDDLAAQEVRSSRLPLLVPDVERSERYREFAPPVRTFMTFPIPGDGGVRGTITTFNRAQESVLSMARLGPEDQDVFSHFVRYLERAIANATDFARSRQLAERDELTGLPDLASFRARLLAEISRARRFNLRFALITCEVLPPSGGEPRPPEGEPQVVRDVAGAIRGALRDYDTVARIGERTFGIMLPQIQNGSVSPMARIQDAVSKAASGKVWKVKISNTVFPDNGSSGDEILASLGK